MKSPFSKPIEVSAAAIFSKGKLGATNVDGVCVYPHDFRFDLTSPFGNQST